MAATLTPASELTYVSFPITKFETTVDGDLYVYGKATDGSVDSDEQIVDTDFSSKAIADWLATGANVRVQHNAQRDPAGVGVEVNTDSDGTTWVKSLVVEPVAKTLVEKKALRAYSVGIARPKIVRDSVARGGRIVDGEIVEISLVDRPANKNCGIELVKADKDGNVEFTGKMFGSSDLLIKSETVVEEVTLPASSTFTPADLAKLLAHREVAEKRQQGVEVVTRADGSPLTVDKRQMDPNVGGGVDRDKIPSGDFAGRDRSFPIVTPGDVSDAASSIGRAGSSNYSSDKLKANIIRIAHRKGDAFVAELPASWKKELGMKADDNVEAEKGEKPFEDAHPKFGEGHQPPHTAEDDEASKGVDAPVDDTDDGKDDVEEPDATKGDAKGMKTCGSCNKGFDADSKLRRCPNCNAKLPKADKSAAEKGQGGMKPMCTNCGCKMGAKSAFCKKCGTAMKADDMKDGDVEKTHKPTPGAGVVGAGASDVQPVPEHREPDGEAIEELEHDMHIPTVPDASVKAADRVKSIGAPFDLGALHDLTCPAFDRAEVSKAYPAHTLSGIDEMLWQQKALDAAANAPLEEAGRMTQLWQHASTLKAADADMLDEIRDDMHKSFTDANPGPGTFPTPMELSPIRFRRPVIRDGHAVPGIDYDGPNTAPIPPSGGIHADEFNRGYRAGGHAADSPSNKNTAVMPAPVPTGSAQRTYYRNIQRDSARSAMEAMHDHIAQTFPDLCSMTGPGTGGEAPVGVRPVPAPVGKAAEVKDKKAKKAKEPVVAKAATLDADLVKSAVVDALTPLAAQLELLTKALSDEQAKNAKLAATVDELSNMADPTVTAFKGVAAPDALKSSTSVTSTVASAAERTQAVLMAALNDQARHSPDPSEREAAWAKLYQMNGIQ
jgi:Caudovirus prohead protease.